MELKESILTQNPCYKAGKKISVKGLMLHSVGCPQPNAETFVRKWNNPESSRACVHAFIDGNTGTVYQTLPWDHKAWHCGGNANSTHIGVEMCEPACLKYTGGASFTCSDTETAMAVVKRTYEAAVELFAFLCQEYGLDPLADGVIISHKEGHDRGLASGHGDPDHLWKGLQCEYTMDTFRQAVAVAMENVEGISDVKKAEQKEIQKKESAENPSIATVKVGDTVVLTADAVYYNGVAMPDWVRKDCWIVKSMNGDRVVIDKNVGGTRAICSPVNMKYIRKNKEDISMDGMKKLMEGLKLTRTQIQGSEKESNFDDVADAGGEIKHIAALCVRSGYIMDAIGVVDAYGTKYLHGNPNGGSENYILLENEEIKNIRGDIGVSFHGKAISNLTIEMKSGKKYGPFGTGKSGQHFSLTLPENTEFAGFYGNADETIVKSLGLIGCEGDGEIFQKMMEQAADGKLPKFGL